MGTSDFAVPGLRALLQSLRYDVVAVVTQPDRPVGRKRVMTPPPVKVVAESAAIPVLQPEKARDSEFISAIESLRADIAIVASYGQILKQRLLDAPRFGCLNIHGSLLPKYRGASPIQSAILNGESETGVTIMQMDVGLDTGDMISKVSTPIRDDDTAQSLHDRLADLGGTLLLETLPKVLAGQAEPEKQSDAEATHVGKIQREDGLIDWKRPAREIWNQARAFDPWPGAFSTVKDFGEIRIWKCHLAEEALNGAPGNVVVKDDQFMVICGEGALVIDELQKQGSRRMLTRDFLAGARLPEGAQFELE